MLCLRAALKKTMVHCKLYHWKANTCKLWNLKNYNYIYFASLVLIGIRKSLNVLHINQEMMG